MNSNFDVVGLTRALEVCAAKNQKLNPNGSRRDIAGITNARGNVVGIMPHPEHAVEKLTGPTTDGLGFFTSLLSSLVNNGKVSA